jgi:hypothetical protein
MEKIVIVTRIFQRGASSAVEGSFNWSQFEEKHAKPIRHLLQQEIVQSIVVVVNGTEGNPMAEIRDEDGLTPSIAAFRGTFPEDIRQSRLVVLRCDNWGKNPGSAVALNLGMETAQDAFKPNWIMAWSPEFQIDSADLHRMLFFAERSGLSVVGKLRQLWWLKFQWNVPQNTAAIWNAQKLHGVNLFSPLCNGTGETVKVLVPQLGEKGEMVHAPVAGMEDAHTMLRMMKNDPDFKWGMVGAENPTKWIVDHGNEKAMRDHYTKMARQEGVMRAWASAIYHDELESGKLTVDDVLEMLFSRSLRG